MVRIPNVNDDVQLVDLTYQAPPWTEGFYILAQGCATGTAANQIAQVNIAFSYELQPITSAQIMSPMAFSPPGHATVAAISTMLRQFPML